MRARASSRATIEAFVAAWNSADLERVMAFLAPDACFHNRPFAPVHGAAAIRHVLRPFLAQVDAVDWTLHRIAVTDDGAVLTERSDRFRVAGRWYVLPVMGVFELGPDGLIARWVDYFDARALEPLLAAFADRGPAAPEPA